MTPRTAAGRALHTWLLQHEGPDALLSPGKAILAIEAEASEPLLRAAHDHLYRLMTDSEDRPTTGFVMCECGDVQSIAYDDMADKIESDIPQARAARAASVPAPLDEERLARAIDASALYWNERPLEDGSTEATLDTQRYARDIAAAYAAEGEQ